jgi:MYXO-CTERM domain-containing protein
MGQWLDMQRFDLDAAFAGQTLTSIVFTDNGMNGVQRLNLFGITAVVPGPGALALLGALGLSASRRRR